MNEDGTAAAGNTRTRIVINLDDEIVELSLQVRQSTLSCGDTLIGRLYADRGSSHQPSSRVILCTGNDVAVVDVTVGTPPQPPEPENSAWGGAVALAFVGLDAGAPSATSAPVPPR